MNREEFGAALRSWRERLAPGEVGLPSGPGRRTPGLRREEVGRLAGISPDYLTRLEQGRGPRPSDSVVTALARALRLTGAEREHLFHLAGVAPPLPGRVSTSVRPSVLRLLDRFTDLPALLVNVRLDILAWNTMACALLGDLSALAPGERNAAWRRFVAGDRVGPDPVEQARVNRSLVAQLRDTAAQYPDDSELRQLVARLRAGSTEFARLWDERRISEAGGDRKSFVHPDVGVLVLDCDVLRVPGDDHRLIVYSAGEGSRDAEALGMLRILGAQRLAHT